MVVRHEAAALRVPRRGLGRRSRRPAGRVRGRGQGSRRRPEPSPAAQPPPCPAQPDRRRQRPDRALDDRQRERPAPRGPGSPSRGRAVLHREGGQPPRVRRRPIHRPHRHPQPGDGRGEPGARRSGRGASGRRPGTRRHDRGPQRSGRTRGLGRPLLRGLPHDGAGARRAGDGGPRASTAPRDGLVVPGVQPAERGLCDRRRGHHGGSRDRRSHRRGPDRLLGSGERAGPCRGGRTSPRRTGPDRCDVARGRAAGGAPTSTRRGTCTARRRIDATWPQSWPRRPCAKPIDVPRRTNDPRDRAPDGERQGA